jgi:DNA-binding MarR family transcriptional regulator
LDDKGSMPSSVNTAYDDEAALRRGIELLYFGYRHMTSNADARLAEQGLGRAHHRTLYFVARQPGLMVGDLLKLLNVTKQSLARVLSDLSKRGLIVSKTGDQDRRQRHLSLTDAGTGLERLLFNDLCNAIAPAYKSAGPVPVEQFWSVLELLIPHPDRERVLGLQIQG